ncbi:MAG: PAS domain-containing sensor histidine kinase [Proteobacteria bacterium]|nr:PAS domain-containing sensor histidine kinase [Pseudomonadota bacterium]
MAGNQRSAIHIILASAGLAVLLAAAAAYLSAVPDYAIFFDDLHWTVATAAAAAMAWLGYQHAREDAATARPRYWFAWGLTSYALGQFFWDLQGLAGWYPFPAPSDLFYLLIGPFCAIGFAAALQPSDPARTKGPGQHHAGDYWAFGLDAAALVAAVLAITLALYLPLNQSANPFQLGVLVAYPVSLIGAVCAGLVLMLTLRPRPALAWLLLLAMLLVMGLIWMLWNALVLNSAVGTGKGMNLLFSVSSLFAGYAAATWRVEPSRHALYARLANSIRYLLPMALVVLACTAIILTTAFTDMKRSMQVVIDTAAILVAVLAIARQSFLLKEREVLLKAEGEARYLEQRLRDLVSVSDDPIFVCRVEKERFVYEELNAAALAVIGRSPADFHEVTPYDIMPPDLATKVYALYRECVAVGQPMRYDYCFESPTGTHWFDTRLMPVRDETGRVTHLYGVARSVTDLKHQTDRLQQLAADLDRARRDAESANRAKSMFLANMSHELRTPLNAILGFTELMERKVFGPIGQSRYEGYLHDIYSSGQMLLMLVNQVLDFSKLEAGQYRLQEAEIDMGEVVADTCKLLDQQAQAKVLTLTHFRRPSPNIKADRRALAQIVMNLVANSLKFTPKGGAIEVTTGLGSDGRPEIMVRDTGIGIPPTEIESVRRAFVQGSGATRAAEAGTGLGLAIVCSMAELHGGSVDIDSAVGRGTTVTIRLPASRLLAA